MCQVFIGLHSAYEHTQWNNVRFLLGTATHSITELLTWQFEDQSLCAKTMQCILAIVHGIYALVWNLPWWELLPVSPHNQ